MELDYNHCLAGYGHREGERTIAEVNLKYQWLWLVGFVEPSRSHTSLSPLGQTFITLNVSI